MPSICRDRRARTSWKRVDRQVRDWLLALPKPAAILASNDVPARHLAEMCRLVGLRVPEQIATLGRRQRRTGVPTVPSAAVERRQSGRADRLSGRETAAPVDGGRPAAKTGHLRSRRVSSRGNRAMSWPCPTRGRLGGGGLHPRSRGRRHHGGRGDPRHEPVA